ncbi:MAG: hypothetical protein QXP86_01960 [Nitrososphaerota archaeon]
MEEHASEAVRPLHAHEFMLVSTDGVFNQILSFDYHDPAGFYHSLLKDEERYYMEMSRLIWNMQSLLDDEVVKVNGENCRPEVLTATLDFRGSENLPCITFFIQFKTNLKAGTNVYECFYEEEVTEYDYEVYWVFPLGAKIIDVDVRTEKDLVAENVLILWARAGDNIGCYERVVFNIPATS